MQGFNRYFENQSKLLIKKANNLKNRSHRQFAYRAAVLIGIFLGNLLDKRHPVQHISWTLNMILIGGIIGFCNANVWFYRTIGLHNKTKGDKK